jgi:hypothetical protein
MMEFDEDITPRLLGYLRQQHGETDTNKFYFDWTEDGPVVTRWDFTDIPKPTSAQLKALPQPLVDFFATHERGIDIFTGKVEGDKGEVWRPVPLTPARCPSVSSQETEGSDLLKLLGGFWKLSLLGDSGSGVALRIVSEGGEVFAERAIPPGSFDVARPIYFPADTSIKLLARHVKVSTATRDHFKLDFTLFAEKV